MNSDRSLLKFWMREKKGFLGICIVLGRQVIELERLINQRKGTDKWLKKKKF